MNPVLERNDRLVAFLGAWALAGAVLAGLFRGNGSVGWGAALALMVPHAVLFGFINLSSWYVCTTTPLRRMPLLPATVNLAAAAVVSVALWYAAGLGWVTLLARFASLGTLKTRYATDALLVVELGLLLYALSLAINYIAIGIQESRAAERQVMKAQVFAKEAELRALRAQIDPHFLFNALNSVSALTTVDPPAARRMCVLLSDYLRSSSRLGGQEMIRLADEMALARQYLDIEKVRFGARLVVAAHWDPALGACLVPPLMLQPLVENAVTHGIANVLDGGTITISVARTADTLVLTIDNPRDEDVRRPQTGFGLQNVRRRLEAHYGARARLDVKEAPDLYSVRVTIPCDRGAVTGEESAR
jgi:two-component system, LytTR family, sensor histidine kinase AlgZ